MAEVNTNGQITSLATAKSFGLAVEDGGASAPDVAVPLDAIAVLLQAETQNIRLRYDGTAPTASVGFVLVAGDAPIRLEGKGKLRNLKVVEVAASAKLNYGFEG
jgi:hypothetical protein